ncbi:zinc finger BED domain-containing protein RICESLEEPER 2-like [Pistacia vera]|uniref:zinc finger BED domain-containing protein RICESLEEPER 2-like n=1 Tax=Pistacia vera TaxID=55513 RepID=UPI001262C15C|nr:zinc finger BED domain-containing protein RICESLEEPER 2-like [Pistacia vera]
MEDSIFRIHSTVRYVRSSPARLQRFKECVELEKIEQKNLLVLDVETRWNSTYLMLDVALKFQKAFELLEIQDSKYKDELTRGEKSRGLPMPSDWEYACYLLPFLKVFYDATLHVLGSLFVTGNAYMREIFAIGMQISTWCRSDDVGLSTMARRMKGKHDKYWSNIDNINLMLFIAVVLDPRFKLGYVNWVISKYYDDANAELLKTKVHTTLYSLFNQYKLIYSSPSGQSSQQSQQASQVNVEDVNVDPKELMYCMYDEAMARQEVTILGDLLVLT